MKVLLSALLATDTSIGVICQPLTPCLSMEFIMSGIYYVGALFLII